MPAYKFANLPASRPVSVYPAAGGASVSTGTTDSNGSYFVTLTEGNYTARVTNPRGGYLAEAAEEEVDQSGKATGSGPEVFLKKTDASATYPQARIVDTAGAAVTLATKRLVVTLDSFGDIDDLTIEAAS